MSLGANETIGSVFGSPDARTAPNFISDTGPPNHCMKKILAIAIVLTTLMMMVPVISEDEGP